MSDQKIKKLSRDTIEKIAAGEVIERPASVVKELIENAIDAEASRIVVNLDKGGAETIQVIDNGKGMSEADAKICIQHHATSKIEVNADLSRLKTLGFRGEALSSICAVSIFSLETKTESGQAIRIEVEGGEVKNMMPSSRDKGTTVTVKNIFFNVPARKKFLKGERSEMRRIITVVEELAMAHPEIAFAVNHNGRETLGLPAVAKMEDRLENLWGKEICSKMSSFSSGNERLSLVGYIGHPQISRATRGYQHLFVNGRAVSDRNLQYAVKQAYGNLIPSDRFPVFALFLRVDPDLVDANVHPTKREVRFADPGAIRSLIYSEIGRSLAQAESSMAVLETSERKQFSESEPESLKLFNKLPDRVSAPPAGYRAESTKPSKQMSEETGQRARDGSAEDALSESGIQFIQLHNLYILTQIKNGLLLIDQHAAHERILYEKALKDFEEPSTATQQLLFPVVMELRTLELAIVEQNIEFFTKLGFDVRPFGGSSLAIEGIPARDIPLQLINNDIEGTIRDMVDYLLKEDEVGVPLYDRIAKSYACGAAIKAGHRLGQEEMESLINMLFMTQSPYTCPHGRPTIVRMSLEEISKRFLR